MPPAFRDSWPERRSVSVLGSTGSIGCQTLELLALQPGRYRITALTANGNWQKLAEQARAFRPRTVAITDESAYASLKEALSGTDIRVSAGAAAVEEAASEPAEWTMAAIVGAAGLKPTLAAIRQGGTLALANKECLVCAGDLLMREVKNSGAILLPVDSEHSAIFQVFEFSQPGSVEKITLTASGGPFREWSVERMKAATPEEAVKHPKWNMGAKISVDSATLMNKGLELIEAYHLFPVREEQIEILVHPESAIHGLVQYEDGSLLAQLGQPDMRTPIAYAMEWPQRLRVPAPRLDLAALGRLRFERVDTARFPAPALARAALREGGSATITLNAANEIAVSLFLAGAIGFLDIAALVERTLESIPASSVASLEDTFAADGIARARARELGHALSSLLAE